MRKKKNKSYENKQITKSRGRTQMAVLILHRPTWAFQYANIFLVIWHWKNIWNEESCKRALFCFCSFGFPFWMMTTVADYCQLLVWKVFFFSRICRMYVIVGLWLWPLRQPLWPRHRWSKTTTQSAFIAASSLMLVWCVMVFKVFRTQCLKVTAAIL